MRSAIAVCLLFLATAVSAQQPLSEQITVNVVEVPVYVSRAGQSVAGLTKDDFTLTVNGQTQNIDFFDVIANETTEKSAPAETQQVDVDRRRMIVLLFDLSQSSVYSLQRAQKAAEKFVLEAPRGDVFAVAMLTRDGVKFARPFMNDRGAIQRAVATLGTGRARDVFGIASENLDRTQWTSEARADASGLEPLFDQIWDVSVANRLAFEESGAAQLAATVESHMAQFEGDVRQAVRKSLVDHVGELATRISPLNGIKHVVLLSEGSAFVSTASTGSATAMVSPLAARESLQKMHKRFREAGVVLDAVDTANIAAPWCNDCADASYDANSMLHSMSLDTGGTVARGLPMLRKSQRVTYILGFRPGPALVQANENAITVRLKKMAPLTEVRYPRTWSSSKPLNGPDEGLFLADVLINDIPQNGMTLTLGTSRDADSSAVVTATVPGKELLAIGNALMSLEAFVYIFDAKGQVAEWVYRKSRLDLIRGRDALSAEPYTITARVKLAPGKYVAKVLLRAVENDATAFARTEFAVN